MPSWVPPAEWWWWLSTKKQKALNMCLRMVSIRAVLCLSVYLSLTYSHINSFVIIKKRDIYLYKQVLSFFYNDIQQNHMIA